MKRSINPHLSISGKRCASYLSGEPWRLLSSIFLHSSVSHLLMNMFAFLVVGGVAEQILGKWRLLITWLFSGRLWWAHQRLLCVTRK
ncbi:rhomboid family protein [Escherichia coli]|nr:rhomboid family protein [Escherichia coli]